MSESLLFLTGKLAEKSLLKVLASMEPTEFTYRVEQIGITVAALMTPEMIARRVSDIGNADKIIVPGLCRGDLSLLEQKYGIPVLRGPEDLKDIPQFFGKKKSDHDLSRYRTRIFAEIVDAPFLRPTQILARSELFRSQGANVIDLGCLPNTPFPHLSETIQTLKKSGFKVSVDSLNVDELIVAGSSGADYLLSLTEKTLWVADEVPSTPVLIPSKSGNLSSLYRAIDIMKSKSKQFIADPILDPIPFGFVESIHRYRCLRKRYPDVDIMMGIGNITELVDADTSGINALLFGMIAELDIDFVLTTSVSSHAINAVSEADLARRMMFAAKEDSRLPRDYSNGLLVHHDKRPFPYSEDEIKDFASQVKDPSFRIQVSDNGFYIYNRDGISHAIDPFEVYSKLEVDDDASHAFYLGVELARAQIAWQLKKRYTQDEELTWGSSSPIQDKNILKSHRSASLKEKNQKDNPKK